jgi:hypothetical protein
MRSIGRRGVGWGFGVFRAVFKGRQFRIGCVLFGEGGGLAVQEGLESVDYWGGYVERYGFGVDSIYVRLDVR